jgi:3-oxoacyl-[acyl-carrier protein] reductase
MTEGRVAVVTGAAGAIGGSIAATLAGDGFTVVGVDISGSADETCDVRSEGQVQALRDRLAAGPGDPWLLVNVAGVFFEHRVTELEVDDWDLLLDTNLKGTFLTIKACLPAMKVKHRGRIVVTSSITGPITGYPGWSHYGASKAGQLGFMLQRRSSLHRITSPSTQ